MTTNPTTRTPDILDMSGQCPVCPPVNSSCSGGHSGGHPPLGGCPVVRLPMPPTFRVRVEINRTDRQMGGPDAVNLTLNGSPRQSGWGEGRRARWITPKEEFETDFPVTTEN